MRFEYLKRKRTIKEMEAMRQIIEGIFIYNEEGYYDEEGKKIFAIPDDRYRKMSQDIINAFNK